jgi:hypothetical protein
LSRQDVFQGSFDLCLVSRGRLLGDLKLVARRVSAQMDRGSRVGSPSGRQSRDQRDSNRDNSDRFRTTYRDRNREYSLRESEVQTLIDFRQVTEFKDLADTRSEFPAILKQLSAYCNNAVTQN